VPSSAYFRPLCLLGFLIVWSGALTGSKVWCFEPAEDNAPDQIKLQSDHSIIWHSKRRISSIGSNESGKHSQCDPYYIDYNYYSKKYYYFLWLCSPARAMASPFDEVS
jgi:hypothetical protein